MSAAPILKWIYTEPELDQYTEVFHIILLAGGMNAGVTFLGYVITIMRMQDHMFWIYGVTFVLAVFVPDILVKKEAVMGAAISFTILAGTELLLLVLVYILGEYRSLKAVAYQKRKDV